jgi:hypothetical protein
MCDTEVESVHQHLCDRYGKEGHLLPIVAQIPLTSPADGQPWTLGEGSPILPKPLVY